MPDKLTFLDANVLLEILLARKHDKAARAFIEKNAGHLAISTLTAHLVIHFGSKIVDLPILRQFLGDYYLLEMTYMDFDWAFNNARSSDFEDALQIGIAIRNGCNEFVTFEAQLYKNYKALPTIKIKLLK